MFALSGSYYFGQWMVHFFYLALCGILLHCRALPCDLLRQVDAGYFPCGVGPQVLCQDSDFNTEKEIQTLAFPSKATSLVEQTRIHSLAARSSSGFAEVFASTSFIRLALQQVLCSSLYHKSNVQAQQAGEATKLEVQSLSYCQQRQCGPLPLVLGLLAPSNRSRIHRHATIAR